MRFTYLWRRWRERTACRVVEGAAERGIHQNIKIVCLVFRPAPLGGRMGGLCGMVRASGWRIQKVINNIHKIYLQL